MSLDDLSESKHLLGCFGEKRTPQQYSTMQLIEGKGTLYLRTGGTSHLQIFLVFWNQLPWHIQNVAKISQCSSVKSVKDSSWLLQICRNLHVKALSTVLPKQYSGFRTRRDHENDCKSVSGFFLCLRITTEMHQVEAGCPAHAAWSVKSGKSLGYEKKTLTISYNPT